MMKGLLPLLGLLALSACRTPKQAAAPNYDATRQRADQSQQQLNAEPAPSESR